MTQDRETTPPAHTPGDPDWLLQDLVALANKTGVAFGITVNSAGLLISGELASGADFFRAFADDFSAGFEDAEAAAVIREHWAGYSAIYEKSDDETPLPQLIHIRNARIYYAGQMPIPANRGVWWRGRLEDISGFAMGALAVG